MAWFYLLLAGLFEIGWPVGLKFAQNPSTRWQGVLIAMICISLSGYTMWLAQREIPLGTVYAIWTGLGASGAFFIGIHFYGEPATLMRYFGVLLIISGVAVLKLAN
ncbi:DMT family transporter [Endozoicomonas ascidiicola]|uniref:DMT family transporter n=1 Tax=Endozoicomonas ascidiicola TaxID=1698521 RepID=UPI000832D1E1|nr:multidrug efflux SMR transporter [Endozoicomonas ascidiicola]